MPNNQIFEDISEYNNTTVLTRDAELQEDYFKNRLQTGNETAYLKYNQAIPGFQIFQPTMLYNKTAVQDGISLPVMIIQQLPYKIDLSLLLSN